MMIDNELFFILQEFYVQDKQIGNITASTMLISTKTTRNNESIPESPTNGYDRCTILFYCKTYIIINNNKIYSSWYNNNTRTLFIISYTTGYLIGSIF